METYKIINGKRHYWDIKNQVWKLDNRTQAQAEADAAKSMYDSYDSEWLTSIFDDTEIRIPSSGKTKKNVRSGNVSRRKKKKSRKKPFIIFLIIIGMIAGGIYNYVYTSPEELYIKEYLEELIVQEAQEGETNEND